MSKIVKLRQPLSFGGKEHTEIEVRRSTIGAEEDAMQQAVDLGRAKNPLTVEMCILGKLARVPYDAMRAMDPQDYAAIRDAANSLNGAEPEAAPGENLTPESS